MAKKQTHVLNQDMLITKQANGSAKPTALFLVIALMVSVVSLSMFACTLSTFIMQAVSYYHVSAASAGTLESYQNLSMVLFLILLFPVITKLGFKQSMIAILAVMVIISLLLPFIASYLMIKIYLIGLGLVFVAMKVIVYSCVPQSVNYNERQQAMLLSLLELLWALASLAGMWIMAHFMEHNRHYWLGFTWVFAAGGVVAIIFWLLTPLAKNISNQAIANENSIVSSLKNLWFLAKQPLLIAVIVILFIANVIEMGFGAWLPAFYQQAMLLPNFLSIKVASLGLVAAIIGRLVVIVLLKYMSFGRALLMFYTIGFIVLGYALFAVKPLVNATHTAFVISHVANHQALLWHSLPLSAFILAFFAFFISPSAPLINSSILARTHKEKHVLLMTLLTIIFAFASSLGARLIGQLIDYFGIINGFKLATLLPLGVLVLFIIPYERFIGKRNV